jgi:hypothetical protein
MKGDQMQGHSGGSGSMNNGSMNGR